MKKILTLGCFLFLISAAYGATAIMGNTPAVRPDYNSYNPNAAINTKQLIQGQQDSIRSKYFNKMVPQTSQTPQRPQTVQPAPAPPHGHGPHYIPRTYAIEYVNNKDKQNVTINNTYNYYNTEENTETAKKEEKKSVELTQKQKDEAERKALKKKYSSILSNTTMENSKMCSKMAAQFPGVSKDELDRLLNRILRLNCNISKL